MLAIASAIQTEKERHAANTGAATAHNKNT